MALDYSQQQAATPPVSKAALTSMVAGLLGCLPVLASLTALVLGIVGLRKTSNNRMSGRGFAIVGVVLGSLGLLGWTGIGIAGVTLVKSGDPARAFVREYMTNLTTGDLDFTTQHGSAQFDKSTMIAFRDYLQTHGGEYRGMTFRSFSVKNTNGVVVWDFNGVANFSSGPADVWAQVQSAGGTYTMLTLRLNNTNWPDFDPSAGTPQNTPVENEPAN